MDKVIWKRTILDWAVRQFSIGRLYRDRDHAYRYTVFRIASFRHLSMLEHRLKFLIEHLPWTP